MADRILLGATRQTFDECFALACELGLGLEIQTFAYPEVLTHDLEPLLSQYAGVLNGFPGERALHGAFIDMASGSPDPLIRTAVDQRVRQAMEIAQRLGARTIVFHANFIATMRNQGYRRAWLQHQVDFWGPLGERAAQHGLTLALENMWEFEPSIIGDILARLDLPGLRACLDIGHASLFSDPQYTIGDWIRALTPFLVHIHMNNNPGTVDEHHALDDGVIDYRQVLPLLRALPEPPALCLEISGLSAIRRSLSFLRLQGDGRG